MWTMFGSYDHLMNVYLVYVFNDLWLFCLVAKAKLKQEICKAPAGKEGLLPGLVKRQKV